MGVVHLRMTVLLLFMHPHDLYNISICAPSTNKSTESVLVICLTCHEGKRMMTEFSFWMKCPFKIFPCSVTKIDWNIDEIIKKANTEKLFKNESDLL